jgi:putative phosphoesterase
MPDSRLGGQMATPPSEASFVLGRRASAIHLQPQGRSGPPVPAFGSDDRSQPPTVSTPGRSHDARGAAATSRGGESRRGGGATSSESAAQAPEGAPQPERADARIGIISDNHGLFDPTVLEIFAGVTHIIHAGDIMDPEILNALRTIAPVTAVAGNMDSGGPTAELPREVAGEVAGVRFVVGHKRKRLLKRLTAGRIEGGSEAEPPDLVIYGHDHVAAAAWVDGTLFLNPGTASSPDDEDDGPTVAIVSVTSAGLAVCFIPLERRDVDETSARPGGA